MKDEPMTSRRQRPTPPLQVKLLVAARQVLEIDPQVGVAVLYGQALYPIHWALGGKNKRRGLGKNLAVLLAFIASRIGCSAVDLRLDHEPALRVRAYNPRIKDISARYTPNANDPAYLRWRPQPAEFEGSHHIKTNVRGDGAQFSDTVLIKRERRRERGPKKRKGQKIAQRKNPWPKRKFGGRR